MTEDGAEASAGHLLSSQRAYYDRRAPDYSSLTTPSDRNTAGLLDVEVARMLIDELRPSGDVLELACGPGMFTRELARHARTLTAVDASPSPTAFRRFWALVRECLVPGGRVAFVDEDDRGAAFEEVRLVDGVPTARRTLSDGTQFDIVKVYWESAQLQGRLTDLGFDIGIRRVGETFMYGVGMYGVGR